MYFRLVDPCIYGRARILTYRKNENAVDNSDRFDSSLITSSSAGMWNEAAGDELVWFPKDCIWQRETNEKSTGTMSFVFCQPDVFGSFCADFNIIRNKSSLLHLYVLNKINKQSTPESGFKLVWTLWCSEMSTLYCTVSHYRYLELNTNQFTGNLVQQVWSRNGQMMNKCLSNRRLGPVLGFLNFWQTSHFYQAQICHDLHVYMK